jgi:hypothetical protein
MAHPPGWTSGRCFDLQFARRPIRSICLNRWSDQFHPIRSSGSFRSGRRHP